MTTHLFEFVRKKPGTAPGVIQYTGEKKVEKTRIRVIQYDKDHLSEKEFETIDACLEFVRSSSGIRWVNIDGLHDPEVIKAIGAAFGVHALILEDIVSVTQRPKVELYDKHLFVVMKMFYTRPEDAGVESEQMSFVLGKDLLLSFQEKVGDVFEEVRRRLRTSPGGIIRGSGADYLLYAVTDAIVDHYFLILERLGNDLETVDEELEVKATPETLRQIHALKKQVLYLKKMTWPLRELFGSIARQETDLIRKQTNVYFRDVQDHSMQVLDSIEGFREMISGMIDLYQSSVSNKMNEVMKVLTIIATLFIPPTFIAGIYGMNFDHMPELHVRFGYFFAIGVMVLLIVSMLIYFRRKRWL